MLLLLALFQSIGSMMEIDHTNLSRLDLNCSSPSTRPCRNATLRKPRSVGSANRPRATIWRAFADSSATSFFTRGADGMRLTPRALALAQPVQEALRKVQSAALQGGAFNPATANRVFRIGLADSIEVAIIPALVERLQTLAPGVSLRLRLGESRRYLAGTRFGAARPWDRRRRSSTARSTTSGVSSIPITFFACSAPSSSVCRRR